MLGPMPRNDEVARLLGSDYGEVLWEPGPEVIDQARITQYLRWLAGHHGVAAADYQDLWEWSVVSRARSGTRGRGTSGSSATAVMDPR